MGHYFNDCLVTSAVANSLAKALIWKRPFSLCKRSYQNKVFKEIEVIWVKQNFMSLETRVLAAGTMALYRDINNGDEVSEY